MQALSIRKGLLRSAVLASGLFASVAAHAAVTVTAPTTGPVVSVGDNTITVSGPNGSVTSSGASIGINANLVFPAIITINDTSAAAEVSTTGTGAAISMVTGASNGGTLTVASGAVVQSSNQSSVVFINAANTSATTIANAGTISSLGSTTTQYALDISGNAAFGVTIANSGTIRATGGTAINSALSDNAGTVTFTNTSTGTVTGHIVASGAASTFDIQGGTIAGNISSIGAAINTTVSGSFTTGGTMALGTGTLAINTVGNTFNVGHSISNSGATTFSLGTTTNVNASTALIGAKTVNGTVRVLAGTATAAATTGAITANNGGRYVPQIRGGNAALGISQGELWGAAVTLNTGFAIAPELTGNGYLANGSTFDVIKGSSIALDNSTLVQPSSAVVSFAKSTVGNNIRLTTVRNAYNVVASNTNAKNVGAVLESLGITMNSDLGLAAGYLDRESNAALIDSSLMRLTPDVNGSVMNVAMSMENQALGTVANRLDNLRAGVETPNYAAGEYGGDRGAWVQLFGNTATQQMRSGITGYKSDSLGAGLGMDWMAMKDLRVGLGLSIANNHASSKHVAKNHLEVDTYQGSLYGSYDVDSSMYIDGMLSYARSNYDSKRRVLIGSVDRVARADYHGSLTSGKIGTGYRACSGLWETIPSMGYQYTHVRVHGYNENGADSFNLAVNASSISANVLSAGVKFRYTHEFRDNKFVPEMRFGVFHDMSGETHTTVAQFANAGALFGNTFVSKGANVPKTSFNVGAGLGMYSSDEMKVVLAYDYEGKQDYHAHSGSLNFRYEW